MTLVAAKVREPVEGAEVPTASGNVRRLGLGLGLAALSAVLAAASQPPFGWWWLVVVAWVPMLIAQYHVLPRRWSALAPGIGIGGYYAFFLYGTVDASFARWMLAVPLVVAAAVAAGNIGERVFAEETGYRGVVVGFPLVWAAVEFLRGFAPGIGTQGYVAYALFREPRLTQPVSVFGVHALNLLILLVNWAVALGLLAALRRRSRPGLPAIPARVARRSTVAVAAATAGWVLASTFLYQRPTPTVAVAAIQPGTHSQDRVELARSIAQTRIAGAHGARIVVWREKALAGDPRVTPTGAVLTGLARQTGVYLVVGYQVVTPRGQRNEATVISPDGRFLGVYGKQHPAIMFADDQTSITAGGMPIYHTPYGRLATIICFDLDYTDTARQAARRGAQILAVPSWDPPGDATKHYPLLVFRAIENRLSVIKADSAYDSAIIDPYGNIVESVVTPGGSRATLDAAVAAGSGHTPLTVLGDLWGWLLVAAAGVTIAGRLRRH